MTASWTGPAAALAAGHMMIAGALAAPLAGSGMGASAHTDFVRVQAMQPSEAVQDRMGRLWQHRQILQDALQPPVTTRPDRPPEPQARALQAPEPMIVTAPTPTQSADEDGVTCEAAARIVSDFGFSDIGNPDCSGDLYRFSAMRDGTAYAIGISAATGEIAEVSRQ